MLKRKTRKFPDMCGSIRKRKKDLKVAKSNFFKLYPLPGMKQPLLPCSSCVSEPICKF